MQMFSFLQSRPTLFPKDTSGNTDARETGGFVSIGVATSISIGLATHRWTLFAVDAAVDLLGAVSLV